MKKLLVSLAALGLFAAAPAFANLQLAQKKQLHELPRG